MRNLRVISRLDIKFDKVVKGIHLEGWKQFGDASTLCKKYYNQGADEILLIDSVASLYDRDKIVEIIKNSAKNLFIPLTSGGGIKSVWDAEELFRSGADKVAINSAAIKKPELIKEISKNFGSQSLVISIQAKKNLNNWNIYFDTAREKTDIEVTEWIKRCQDLGAGEFLITSIDKDGTEEGFDFNLLEKVSDVSEIPIIASGGFGKLSHLDELLNFEKVTGLAIAKAFHKNSYKINEIKNYLFKKKIPVRFKK